MLPRPCRDCGRPGKSLCDNCSAKRQSKRPLRQQRGYDSTYEHNRELIVRAVMNDPLIKCIICGCSFIGCSQHDITAEHIVPVRRGGSSDLSNLGPAHLSCNVGWNRGKHTPPRSLPRENAQLQMHAGTDHARSLSWLICCTAKIRYGKFAWDIAADEV